VGEASLFSVVHSDRTKDTVQNTEYMKFHTDRRNNFYAVTKGDKALEQAAQRAGGVSFSGDIPALSGHLPVRHAIGNLLEQGVGLRDLQRSLPIPTIL